MYRFPKFSRKSGVKTSKDNLIPQNMFENSFLTSVCSRRSIKKSRNTKCIPGRITELYPRYHPH